MKMKEIGPRGGCNRAHHYQPQQSWAKVMFLQASVILLTGGVSASLHAGIPPPWSRHPPRHPPKSRPPQEQTPPQSRHPLGLSTPLGTKYTPQEADGQRAAGTHSTGMHSCLT